ncbi:hypothetical protein HO173_000182 [Letharia columbiana]|uniref:Uncharacterized protein n=1 Tax=Letharia columbiana TaxID=112416 RepID=A0A8H6G6J5_9LECA|nr:uncharacterized protein HO173_013295 [Letharia columbiana]XP_037170712.1 uncharacterized protein HO173_000182 [Letharia columbiana]KAF6223133.1 hypothetical protein HO173_013295 [Letharia columbiana]KAF6241472.1 hypothetical protein HO173_000182 [Letharia columbiana]
MNEYGVQAEQRVDVSAEDSGKVTSILSPSTFSATIVSLLLQSPHQAKAQLLYMHAHTSSYILLPANKPATQIHLREPGLEKASASALLPSRLAANAQRVV